MLPIWENAIFPDVRVISKKTLRAFYQLPEYRDSQGPLEAWHAEVRKASWKTPHDVKAQYRSASVITDTTIVFNIAGNKYRLVVAVDWIRQIVFVTFVGTHKAYDRLKLR